MKMFSECQICKQITSIYLLNINYVLKDMELPANNVSWKVVLGRLIKIFGSSVMFLGIVSHMFITKLRKLHIALTIKAEYNFTFCGFSFYGAF